MSKSSIVHNPDAPKGRLPIGPYAAELCISDRDEHTGAPFFSQDGHRQWRCRFEKLRGLSDETGGLGHPWSHKILWTGTFSDKAFWVLSPLFFRSGILKGDDVKVDFDDLANHPELLQNTRWQIKVTGHRKRMKDGRPVLYRNEEQFDPEYFQREVYPLEPAIADALDAAEEESAAAQDAPE